MKIAIVGSGAVGGYFGGLLARAGNEVTFIARGAHLESIRARGLRVESVHGDFTIAPAKATDDPWTIGTVDLVIVAVKERQLEAAIPAIASLMGPTSLVLPLLNGIDASERLVAGLGDGRRDGQVLGSICYVGASVASPGVIHQISPFRRIVLGELDGTLSPRVRRVAELLSRAGISAEPVDDIHAARWTKFAFIASFSGVGAVTRSPAGEIIGCRESRNLLARAIQEVEAVARASGIALAPDVCAATLAHCDRLPPHQLASMQRDILAGEPSELESLIGVMVRRGAALSVATPVFSFIYAALLPQEHRAAAGLT